MMRPRLRNLAILLFTCCLFATMWNFSRLSINTWKMKIDTYIQNNVFYDHTRSWRSTRSSYLISDVSSDAAQTGFDLNVNMSALKYKVRDRKECKDVAANPRSYWRSENGNGLLDTSQRDISRMDLAFSCGVLYQDFFSRPPIPTLYPVEKFYLSEPPLVNIDSVSNVSLSVITSYNFSLQFRVGETAAFKIEMKNSIGHPKQKGGDQIRAWLVDDSTKTQMAAKVVDLNNGTYIVSASLLWAGKLRLHVALAYPREYIRALLYTHRVFKTFSHIAGVFNKSAVSEATPCYHTPVVPGFDQSELCDLTDINGSPWFCGRPIKRQLNCADYAGTVVINKTDIYPVTDAEMELFHRSCREPGIRRIPNTFELTVLPGNPTAKIPCNKVLPQITWAQEIPTGHMSQNTWYPRFCSTTHPDYATCFKNKQILILGDSNGRSHYNNIVSHANCAETKKAQIIHWHRPLLCVNKGNNFSVIWDPHTNPFLSGSILATLDSLIPTSKAIDEIPSHGNYLIILNHYYHLTSAHLSAIDYMFRSIKDALVRLFQRNSNVQVILQGPHIAWYVMPDHYAAGDMLGTYIQDLQQEIFQDIKDKVVFISHWDMTIATQNWDYHPSTSRNMFQTIAELMCGR